MTKYLPDSEITAKGHLDQNHQHTVEVAATYVTPIATNEVKNTNEILLHTFEPTEEIYSDLTGKFTVQA